MPLTTDSGSSVELVADAGPDRLLGAHLLAPHAGEVIQAAVPAIKSGLTVRDLTERFIRT